MSLGLDDDRGAVVVVSENPRLGAALAERLRPRAVQMIDRVDEEGVARLSSRRPGIRASGLVLDALADGPDGTPHGPDHLRGFVDATLPDLCARPDGRVVVVTSAGAATGEGTVPGAAAAGAVVGWARSLVRSLGPAGPTVNVVATSATEARTGKPAAGALLPWAVGDVEVAACVAFLLSPDAGFMTGAVLPADAGASIGIY